jgi:hypothetical protein
VTQTAQDELRKKVYSLPWFHQLDLGEGVMTPGLTPLETLRAGAPTISCGMPTAGAARPSSWRDLELPPS